MTIGETRKAVDLRKQVEFFFSLFLRLNNFFCGIFSGRNGGDAPARKKFEDAGGSKTTETMLVESKFCGKIVGPGGSVIQELQAEYSVKINIDREADENK